MVLFHQSLKARTHGIPVYALSQPYYPSLTNRTHLIGQREFLNEGEGSMIELAGYYAVAVGFIIEIF